MSDNNNEVMANHCRRLGLRIDDIVKASVDTWPSEVLWPSFSAGAVLTSHGYVLHVEVFDLTEPDVEQVKFDTEGPMDIDKIIAQLCTILGPHRLIARAVTIQG